MGWGKYISLVAAGSKHDTVHSLARVLSLAKRKGLIRDETYDATHFPSFGLLG